MPAARPCKTPSVPIRTGETNRRSRFATALGAILGAAALCAAAPPQAGANHDHLKVYAFVLDGLDGDALSEGSAPFISSLIRGEHGARTTYYPDSRSVMVAETNPNHTAMITGAYPNSSGITGNEFAVYGAARGSRTAAPRGPLDPAGEPFATSGENVNCVQVPNLFETVERRKQSQHITTALIMGKPKLARLFATRNAGDGYDADYVWAPCDDDEPYCEDVPTNPATGYALTDEIVMDEVIRTVNAGRSRPRAPADPGLHLRQLPADRLRRPRRRPDRRRSTTRRSRSPTPRSSASSTTRSSTGLWESTVLMIVSDHSMDDTPQLNKVSLAGALTAGGVPAERLRGRRQRQRRPHLPDAPQGARTRRRR